MKYSLSGVTSVLVLFLALNSLVIGAPTIKTPQTTALDARSCSSDKDFKKHGGFCQSYSWSEEEKAENLRKFLEGQEEAARKHQAENTQDATLETRSCSSDKNYKKHGGFCQTYTWSEKEKEENLRKFLEGQKEAARKHQSETTHDTTLEKRSCSSDGNYKEHGGFCQTYTWSEKEKEENLREFLEGQEAARKKHAET